VTYDDVANTLRVEGQFARLVGTTTMAHIHCCTPPTGNAGVATTTPTLIGFPLGVREGSFDTTLDLTAASSFNTTFISNNGGTVAGARARLVSGLFAGQSYFNDRGARTRHLGDDDRRLRRGRRRPSPSFLCRDEYPSVGIADTAATPGQRWAETATIMRQRGDGAPRWIADRIRALAWSQALPFPLGSGS
jgi:hypothetical protein